MVVLVSGDGWWIVRGMGTLSILILLGAINALGLAALSVRLRHNRVANRFLAGLLALVALRLGIYVLGFAGAYDAHPWLTFLPLDMSAAFAPLLWLYVRSIVGHLPPRWLVHLVPAAVQFVYQAACFLLLPQHAKWDWYTTGHLHVVEPVAMTVVLIVAGTYIALCWRDQARYQRWLDTRFVDRELWRLAWLRGMIAVFAGLLAIVTVVAAWHVLVAPLDYFDRTPVMLAFCILAYGLGLLGWRHGDQTYPREADRHDGEPESRADYTALATIWMRRIEAGGWWREEGLTLGEVARRLGTSERSLSRALNDGAGRSFNRVVNGMRIAAVQRAIADPAETRDLLAIAFDQGFASKASFNRGFREIVGTTPSDWRRKIRQRAISADSGAIATAP